MLLLPGELQAIVDMCNMPVRFVTPDKLSRLVKAVVCALCKLAVGC